MSHLIKQNCYCYKDGCIAWATVNVFYHRMYYMYGFDSFQFQKLSGTMALPGDNNRVPVYRVRQG